MLKIDTILPKLALFGGALLAFFAFLFGFKKSAEKDGANKVKLDNAQEMIEGMKKHDEVEDAVNKEVNQIDDIDDYADKRGFLRDD